MKEEEKKYPITDKIGIIILAAGASRRMGTPKQLLRIGNETLLEKAFDLTQQIPNQKTVVVLGANAKKIKNILVHRNDLTMIINDDWEKGMGTTLRKGVNYFLELEQSFQALIIMVCDQPYLTTEKLIALIDLYKKTKANIVATEYGGIKGVPALFSKNLFSELVALNEDEGARKIIKRYKGLVETVNFPKGAIDLDTPIAYQEFLRRQKEN